MIAFRENPLFLYRWLLDRDGGGHLDDALRCRLHRLTAVVAPGNQAIGQGERTSAIQHQDEYIRDRRQKVELVAQAADEAASRDSRHEV